ncbi:DMP19 family protein [Sinorhizobium fredii]|uniref:DMP19 family protein n=1 Tax=Rhizobium fredii TaxID=380 RepID=UPI003393838B
MEKSTSCLANAKCRLCPPSPFQVSNGLVVDSNHIAIDLVATVVDFVNYLFAHGLYRSEELPLHLMQLYHADFYVTQVNNGGHSQFIHNCGARAQTIFINAQAGLSAMGAIHQADLIRELAVWAAANPDKASAQTGFAGGRDPMLDRLDTLFAEVQANDPATRRAAAWIRTWPDVRFTEPAELRAAWNQSALTNPKRSHRLSKARVKAFQQALSDSVHLAIGLTDLCDGNIPRLG